MTILKRTNSENKDFQHLVVLLDQYLATVNGDANDFFVSYNTIDLIHHVVIVYENNEVIGCGAMKEYKPGVMEVKRMFVLPEKRGNNIARLILVELETWAKELRYHKFILETSKSMKAAVRLYEKNHFTKIPRYGQYKDVETSVCFGKNLGSYFF